MSEIKLIIADDHPIFLKGLEEIINENSRFNIVGKATNGNEVLDILSKKEVNVIILDLDMPELNGFDCAKKIIEKNNEIYIILLTIHKKKSFLLKALDLGINGYILKDSIFTDILDAIEAVYNGGQYISPVLSDYKKNNINNYNYFNELTNTEKQILFMISEYKSTKQIANTLFISERTVSNHRMNISRKFNVNGKNGILKFLIQNNFFYDSNSL